MVMTDLLLPHFLLLARSKDLILFLHFCAISPLFERLKILFEMAMMAKWPALGIRLNAIAENKPRSK